MHCILIRTSPILSDNMCAVQQSDHYEPTQMEQDELARALEEVDQQVKSLEQCVSIHGTGATHFLDSFLDVDGEILVETSDICEEVLSST